MAKTITKYDYLDLIKNEPYKIGQVLGFRDFNELHNTWLKEMIFCKSDSTILAHRGSFKTTCLSLAIALIMILYPNKNIIFTRKTDDDVKEIIRQVAKLLNTPLFKQMVKTIYGIDLLLTEENSFNITTNLVTQNKGASQLLGAGIKTSLTGKHADYIFTDDIVNVKDRISKPERDLIKLQYQELQNIKNRTGRIFNTGTKWHKEDAIECLMPNIKIYDCYTTGLIDRKTLEDIRRSMSPSLFSANYELKHIADGDCLFTAPVFTDKTEDIYNGVCHIDASYGGSDGTSFTIVKDYGDRLVMLGKRWDKHIDYCLDEIILLAKHYKGGTIHCEDNGDKGYVAKEIINKGHISKTYHENMNKYIKISTHLKKWWDKIEWLEDTDPDYINEILDYTENAEHDDSPDSASSILRIIKETRTPTVVKKPRGL